MKDEVRSLILIVVGYRKATIGEKAAQLELNRRNAEKLGSRRPGWVSPSSFIRPPGSTANGSSRRLLGNIGNCSEEQAGRNRMEEEAKSFSPWGVQYPEGTRR